jgi:hypothetical protein
MPHHAIEGNAIATNINITLFNPNIIINKIKVKIYIIFNFISIYYLKVLCLINNIKRFNKSSFIKLLIINIIKVNITLLFILKYNTYIFKDFLIKIKVKR